MEQFINGLNSLSDGELSGLKHMGSEGNRVLEGGVFGVEYADNGSGGFVESRVVGCDIGSVVEAASMVFTMKNDGFEVRNTGTGDLTKRVGGKTEEDSKMNDDFEEIVTKSLGCGYEVGDMVWGKVRSYPWWPGQILSEAFASPDVCKTKKEGRVLVAFFGDGSYRWFNPIKLIPFDANFVHKSKQSNNQAFKNAVEDAVDEASRRAALGLVCCCRNPFKFHPTSVRGFFAVDVGGYEPGALYSVKQIKRARDGFRPFEMLSFVHQLALMPRGNLQIDVDWIKNVAFALSYRRDVFEEFDETYDQAFRVQPICSVDSIRVLDQQEMFPSEALLSGPFKNAEAPVRSKSSARPRNVKGDREMHDDREEIGTNPLGDGYEVGDMVWGKVQSYPWWPGQILSEAFVPPDVCKTKEEGHVLVAFFGDDSYRWFKPMELIPFGANFVEKSKQSKNSAFMCAVEEAVAEASRRAALGLVCFCWNPSKFRPTSMKGFFAIDVGGYEPGGLYSMKQIKRAREGFRPAEMISFVHRLALMPQSTLQRDVDRIKNVAVVLAYRRVVFEEFYETYDEAFGVQSICPVYSFEVLDQKEKVSSHASSSGPSEIAEVPGGSKSFAKPLKIEDQHKGDNYLYKRMDEPTVSRVHHVNQGQQGFLSPMYEKQAAPAAGDFVLQGINQPDSRTSEFSGQADRIDTYSSMCIAQSPCLTNKESTTVVDWELCIADMFDRYQGIGQLQPTLPIADEEISSVDKKLEVEKISLTDAIVDWDMAGMFDKSQGFQPPQPRLPKADENCNGLDNVPVIGRTAPPLGVTLPEEVLVTSNDGMDEQQKFWKRYVEGLSFEKPVMIDKKRKVKEESKLESGLVYPPPKHLKSEI